MTIVISTDFSTSHHQLYALGLGRMMDGASVYFLSLMVFVVFAEVSVSRSPGPSPSAAIEEPAGRSPSEVTSKCVVVQASQSPLGPTHLLVTLQKF